MEEEVGEGEEEDRREGGEEVKIKSSDHHSYRQQIMICCGFAPRLQRKRAKDFTPL